MSRESRLLLVTIAVAATVLLMLAQFRFPETPASLPSAAPLERLAARASFEELATRVAQLEAAISPNLIVLRLASRAEPRPVRLRDLVASADDDAPDAGRHVPALRLDATTAMAVVPRGATIAGISGRAGTPGTAGLVAMDAVRGLARIRVPQGPARTLPQRALQDLNTPAYVVAVEGTEAGLTLRPVFLGRSDRFQSPRWSQPLLPLGGILVTPGALFFTLDGEFLGAAVVERGTPAIAAGGEALQLVRELQPSMPPPVDPGIALQPLTPELALAAGTERGVLVVEVVDNMPAADALAPGDVVVEIDGQPATTPEQALLRLSTRLAAAPVSVSFVRQRAKSTATIGVSAPVAANAGTTLALQTVAGAGARVGTIAPGSPAATAGLEAGDLIVKAGDIAAPTAADAEALLRRPEAGVVPLIVRRGDRRHLIVVQRPASSDGGGR